MEPGKEPEIIFMGLDISHYKPTLVSGEPLDFIEIEELAAIPGYLEQNQAFITWFEFGDEDPIPVIYFETVGYQRKGMKIDFYNHFANNALRTDLEFAQEAFTFIQGLDAKHTQKLKINFQQHFIDSFEHGKSLFFAGW